MRMLIVQANTSSVFTQRAETEAHRIASRGTEIRSVTGAFGSRALEGRTEMTIAAHACVSAFAENAEGTDVGVIANFLDPGLYAARELMPFPVLGLGEASMLTACMLGSRFSVITVGGRSAQPIREMAAGYGLASRLASVRVIDKRILDLRLDASGVNSELLVLAEKAISEDGVEVIILGGSSLAGLAHTLAGRVDVPLLDGVTCAVRMAEALVAIAPSKARKGTFGTPPPQELIGVSEGLARAFAPKAADGPPPDSYKFSTRKKLGLILQALMKPRHPVSAYPFCRHQPPTV